MAVVQTEEKDTIVCWAANVGGGQALDRLPAKVEVDGADAWWRQLLVGGLACGFL